MFLEVLDPVELKAYGSGSRGSATLPALTIEQRRGILTIPH